MFDVQQTKDKIIAKMFTKHPWLFNRWSQHSKFVEFTDSPWHELNAPISQCRLALITTGGVHLRSQPPFNMKDPAGDPTFREIPAEARPSDLTITHNYYDHSDADTDINIVFPIERVRTLEQVGDIGCVNHRHFSFMGHIIHHHMNTLLMDTAPEIADTLKADGVDIAILTPG